MDKNKKIIPYKNKMKLAKTYAATLNRDKALKSAGLKKADASIFKDEIVKTAISQNLDATMRDLDITTERVLKEIALIAFDRELEKFKASDKLKALDMLAKYLRLWETGDITINNTQINNNEPKVVKIKFIEEVKVNT